MAAKGKGAQRQKRNKKATGAVRLLKWAVALGAIALVGYGVSQMSGFAYGERDLPMINFENMGTSAKNAVLREANGTRCTCGCGLTLAQCIATDSTCPIRESNITKVRGMVEHARETSAGS